MMPLMVLLLAMMMMMVVEAPSTGAHASVRYSAGARSFISSKLF